MVFSSSSVYSDHPNWHQLQQANLQLDYGGGNFQLEPPPLQQQSEAAAVNGGSSRPGSMVDRARQAKLPQPEAGLKCPRCESTNTKFCYFNNYNLSQPRHFCKTCRRYWTRGGALRSVPVGGGCRRNKRPKKSTSAKPKPDPDNQTGNNPTSTPSHLVNPQTTPQFPFLGALQTLVQSNGGVGGGDSSMGITRFQPQMAAESDGGGGGSVPSGQTLAFQMGFPFLNGLDHHQPTNNFFPYQSEGMVDRSRHFMGIMENNQNWGGPSANTWPEVSGQNSSLTSTSHLP